MFQPRQFKGVALTAMLPSLDGPPANGLNAKGADHV